MNKFYRFGSLLMFYYRSKYYLVNDQLQIQEDHYHNGDLYVGEYSDEIVEFIMGLCD